MLITIPATAEGGIATTSVLDLEPLLAYVRQCRPDALSLMPPTGPDDLPNGAALLTIKNRLEAEGLGVVAGTWEIPAKAPVGDPGWQLQQLFDARWLTAALGEAGVDLLPIRWRPSCAGTEGRDARSRYLAGVLEEAERSGVRLALYVDRLDDEGADTLQEFAGAPLGVCWEIGEPEDLGGRTRLFGGGLLAVDLGSAVFAGADLDADDPTSWLSRLTRTLGESGFAGPLLLRHLGSPAEYAAAVGFVRGLLAAHGRPVLVRTP